MKLFFMRKNKDLMKIIKKIRDHSPIELNNEINIKINNNSDKPRKQSKTQSRETEENAIKKLSNMEYSNQAILAKNGQRFSGGSGGGSIIPQVFNRPNDMSQNNLVSDIVRGVHSYFKPRERTDPNAPSTPSHPKVDEPKMVISELPEQTASVEFLDDEGFLVTDSKEFRDLPSAQQLLLIEDAKRKGRGRPKGSKNKIKKIFAEFETQTEPPPFHSQFDKIGTAAILANEKEQTLKSSGFKKDNAYAEHLKKLSMQQTPPRPDRNVDIHAEL